MNRRIAWSLVGLLSIAILAYSILVVHKLLFGVGLTAGITVSYATWQQGDAETTLVLSVLWSILIGALWTTQLDLILPAVVVTAIAYFTWETLRGGWERPV